MTDTPRHSVSVAGVIVNDAGQVLLTQRADNGHWEPPGGVLELDESIEDGLRREIREETGLEVDIDQLTGVYKNMRRGIVALVFRCRLSDPTADPGVSSEVRRLRWATRDEAAAVMDEAYAVRVTDAVLGGAPALRTHDGVELIPATGSSRRG